MFTWIQAARQAGRHRALPRQTEAPACHLCPFGAVAFRPCMVFYFLCIIMSLCTPHHTTHSPPLHSHPPRGIGFTAAAAAVSSFIIIYALFICVSMCTHFLRVNNKMYGYSMSSLCASEPNINSEAYASGGPFATPSGHSFSLLC